MQRGGKWRKRGLGPPDSKKARIRWTRAFSAKCCGLKLCLPQAVAPAVSCLAKRLRASRAAAAAPNRITIGGAGTSWPPLLLEDEVELLEEEEDEVELLVEVLVEPPKLDEVLVDEVTPLDVLVVTPLEVEVDEVAPPEELLDEEEELLLEELLDEEEEVDEVIAPPLVVVDEMTTLPPVLPPP